MGAEEGTEACEYIDLLGQRLLCILTISHFVGGACPLGAKL